MRSGACIHASAVGVVRLVSEHDAMPSLFATPFGGSGHASKYMHKSVGLSVFPFFFFVLSKTRVGFVNGVPTAEILLRK